MATIKQEILTRERTINTGKARLALSLAKGQVKEYNINRQILEVLNKSKSKDEEFHKHA